MPTTLAQKNFCGREKGAGNTRKRCGAGLAAGAEKAAILAAAGCSRSRNRSKLQRAAISFAFCIAFCNLQSAGSPRAHRHPQALALHLPQG
ncbi:hypothetical protein [Hoeflea sp.]|uniref:hypothetical protein n=1 Tax=Hoeflea sp. TaxID=1940281 RepID=UPI0019CCAC32|nr:hypothetical protein [Hoeflea sp.]MBC7283306.1 hypothetical protein [Hoeflea sp.]